MTSSAKRKRKAERYQRSKKHNDTTLRIRLYYGRLGLGPKQGWTRERFNRLCQMVNCTSGELAALCCIYRPSQLEQWLKHDQFPPFVSLHFALIESFWLKAATPIVPFDLLNTVKHNHTE